MAAHGYIGFALSPSVPGTQLLLGNNIMSASNLPEYASRWTEWERGKKDTSQIACGPMARLPTEHLNI